MNRGTKKEYSSSGSGSSSGSSGRNSKNVIVIRVIFQ